MKKITSSEVQLSKLLLSKSTAHNSTCPLSITAVPIFKQIGVGAFLSSIVKNVVILARFPQPSNTLQSALCWALLAIIPSGTSITNASPFVVFAMKLSSVSGKLLLKALSTVPSAQISISTSQANHTLLQLPLSTPTALSVKPLLSQASEVAAKQILSSAVTTGASVSITLITCACWNLPSTAPLSWMNLSNSSPGPGTSSIGFKSGSVGSKAHQSITVHVLTIFRHASVSNSNSSVSTEAPTRLHALSINVGSPASNTSQSTSMSAGNSIVLPSKPDGTTNLPSSSIVTCKFPSTSNGATMIHCSQLSKSLLKAPKPQLGSNSSTLTPKNIPSDGPPLLALFVLLSVSSNTCSVSTGWVVSIHVLKVLGVPPVTSKSHRSSVQLITISSGHVPCPPALSSSVTVLPIIVTLSFQSLTLNSTSICALCAPSKSSQQKLTASPHSASAGSHTGALLISIITSVQPSKLPLSTSLANNLAVPLTPWSGLPIPVNSTTRFCTVTGTGGVLSLTVTVVTTLATLPQQSSDKYCTVVSPIGASCKMNPSSAFPLTLKLPSTNPMLNVKLSSHASVNLSGAGNGTSAVQCAGSTLATIGSTTNVGATSSITLITCE